MAFFNWTGLLNAKTTNPRRSAPKRTKARCARARLGVEALEERCVPATGLSPSQQYVSQVYVDLLQRPADASGLAYWSGQIKAGVAEQTVVLDLEASQEYRMDMVINLYESLLGREPDPAGLTLWTGYLASNSITSLEEQLVETPEYYQDAGGNPSGFLNRLYENFLGQVIPAASEAYYLNEINNGSAMAYPVVQILGSTEYQQHLVEGFYERFLQRPADTTGLNTYVADLAAGSTNQDIIATMLASPEYSTRTPTAPVVTGPAAPITLNANSYTITGTAETGSLIQVYNDANNSGVLAGGDALVASEQLTPTLLDPSIGSFSITVPLSPATANHFLVTATNSFGTQSPAAAAPTITTLAVTPMVGGVTPAVGPTTGGVPVTITGTGFNGATSVMFGATPAASFTVQSNPQINAVVPAASAQTVNVTVSTVHGTSAISTADQYTYAAVPTVAAVAPASGLALGGKPVVITGTHLALATAVEFGAAFSPSFTINSATQITAVAPVGAAGVVDVRVVAPGGASATSKADQFTYVGPAVTAVTPSSGPLVGGTAVTITGTNFTGVTGVKFGTTPAASFTVKSATQIIATAPAGAVGAVNVIVTTAQGASGTSAADQFTYIGPAITAVAPRVSSGVGGASIVITGSNFTGATGVMFGTIPATKFTINSATQITAIAPAESPGTVNVRVQTPNGVSGIVSADDVTYL